MAPMVTLLFGVVFFQEQRIWAHCGPSPQPSIWAVPGDVIFKGSSVTIFCRTPPGVTKVCLKHSVSDREWHHCAQWGSQEVFEFSMCNMIHTNEGVYYCVYYKKDQWLGDSDKLELVLTGPLPQPSIWAVPGTVVSKGSDVIIFCRTPPGVTRVCLTHHVLDRDWSDCTSQGSQEVFEFMILNMIHTNAGIYYCQYYKKGGWSEISSKLELMVTGVYEEKPSLTIDSGHRGLSERNVTLLCHSQRVFDTFILCRDGNASFPQNCSRQDHKTFIISPLRPRHRRTYRCLGSFKKNSYLWSLPSEPLELPIPESSTSDYKLENCVQISLAILLLLALGALLLDAWKSRRGPHGACREA